MEEKSPYIFDIKLLQEAMKLEKKLIQHTKENKPSLFTISQGKIKKAQLVNSLKEERDDEEKYVLFMMRDTGIWYLDMVLMRLNYWQNNIENVKIKKNEINRNIQKNNRICEHTKTCLKKTKTSQIKVVQKSPSDKKTNESTRINNTKKNTKRI